MKKIKVGLSIGDPNGIGPEIALKTADEFINNQDLELHLIGDQLVVDYYLSKFPDLFHNSSSSIKLIKVDGLSAFQPGVVSAAAGKATINYLTRGVELAQSHAIDLFVACPHHQTAINMAGIPFNGYPGKVAELTNTSPDEVFIMLVGGGLHIAHTTLHEGIRSALNRLSPQLVFNAGKAACETLHKLGKPNPKLAIFGINPHAGENGLFGQEDLEITFPAAQLLKQRGYDVSEPKAADVLLAENKHDVYLAMFHDQGHIPIKLISPNSAAAITIGTNILFSSVAHGSAMDIAGKGIANPQALINAINTLKNSML